MTINFLLSFTFFVKYIQLTELSYLNDKYILEHY